MYNYGSPRVGNRAFVACFNRLVPDSIRVINGTDLVPTLPALLGYRHVDHGVRITTGSGSRGQMMLCGAKDVRRRPGENARKKEGDGGEEEVGEGGGGQRLVQVTGGGAAKTGGGAAKIMELAETLGVVSALGVDEETAADAATALASLVSTAALQDHFEDKYYVALKEVAEKITVAEK